MSRDVVGRMVYLVVRLRNGKFVDLGPELFESEDAAWKAADALNEARRQFREGGCVSVEPATFEVIPRRLLSGALVDNEAKCRDLSARCQTSAACALSVSSKDQGR